MWCEVTLSGEQVLCPFALTLRFDALQPAESLGVGAGVDPCRDWQVPTWVFLCRDPEGQEATLPGTCMSPVCSLVSVNMSRI